MEQFNIILASLDKAIEDGHTVTIKADEVKIEAGDVTVTELEITVE